MAIAGAALLAIAGCAAGQPSPTTAPASLGESAGSPTAIATPPTPTPSPTPRPTQAPPAVTPIPGAPSSGLTIHLVARFYYWKPATIAVPAGQTWRVEIDNGDVGTPHNLTIEVGPRFADRIFNTENFLDGVHSYEVAAFPAGTYTFVCTIHPETMFGTLTIGG